MTTKKEYLSIGNDSKEHTKPVKILIVGDYSIGKTTLITTYLNLEDVSTDEEYMFEEYRVRLKQNVNEVDVVLLDLSAFSKAFERRKYYPTDVNSILICFSIGHFKSLKSTYNLWIHETRAHYGKLIPIFLVGLRSDMRLPVPLMDRSLLRDIRTVKKQEAEVIHKKYKFYGDYLECNKFERGTIVNVINKVFSVTMEHLRLERRD